MLTGWAAIEADFAQFYRLDPFDASWRRFKILLRGLPADSRFVQHVRDEQPPDWRAALSEVTGRNYSQPSRRMSLDDFQRKLI